jgi:hypothetical protein
VVNDQNESTNLAASASHAAILAHLQQRVKYHYGRIYNRDIDHTNITAEQYCTIVKAGQWAEPFGFAPPGPPPPAPCGLRQCADHPGHAYCASDPTPNQCNQTQPPAPPCPPCPPPPPIAPAVAQALSGLWSMHPEPTTELFRIAIQNESTLEVSTVNHTNCWSSLRGSVHGGGAAGATASIVLMGRQAQCHSQPDEIDGVLILQGQGGQAQIKWTRWEIWTKHI